jgi:tetratricopeptide (TPR) repeat protein
MKLGIKRTAFVVPLLTIMVCAVFTALVIHSRTNASPQPRRSRSRSRLRATPTPRRPLPKPVTTARGFNQFNSRDASSRLVVGAATRGEDAAGESYKNGEMAYAAGKFAAAVAAFTEAIRLKPSWPEAHYALALSLNEVKQLEQAIDEFNEVVKLKGAYELVVLSHYNIANNYFDLKKYAEAIAAYRQSIDLDPDRPESRNNLALAYGALDRLPEAIAELEQALKLNPEYAAAHYNLGVAYLQSGKKQQAGEQQRALTKLDAELARRLETLIKRDVRPR